jgi:hypothetical protein
MRQEAFHSKGIRSPLALSLANSFLEFDGSGVTGDRRGFGGLTLPVVSQTLAKLG